MLWPDLTKIQAGFIILLPDVVFISE